jgi:hypothetical protein
MQKMIITTLLCIHFIVRFQISYSNTISDNNLMLTTWRIHNDFKCIILDIYDTNKLDHHFARPTSWNVTCTFPSEKTTFSANVVRLAFKSHDLFWPGKVSDRLSNYFSNKKYLRVNSTFKLIFSILVNWLNETQCWYRM